MTFGINLLVCKPEDVCCFYHGSPSGGFKLESPSGGHVDPIHDLLWAEW